MNKHNLPALSLQLLSIPDSVTKQLKNVQTPPVIDLNVYRDCQDLSAVVIPIVVVGYRYFSMFRRILLVIESEIRANLAVA